MKIGHVILGFLYFFIGTGFLIYKFDNQKLRNTAIDNFQEIETLRYELNTCKLLYKAGKND